MVMPEYLEVGLSLVTLTTLEIILGIDNLVFVAIISHKLPKNKQKSARQLGLFLAWVFRLLFLGSAIWITKLTIPLFEVFKHEFSGRDLFLFLGGLFLLTKATQEIHNELELDKDLHSDKPKRNRYFFVVAQIALLDLVFSIDSVLTAIGLTDHFWLMATSITIAIITMVFASEPLSKFVGRNPSVKMLALSFLMLIGMVLVADGFNLHIPRAYVYSAMGFSLSVEILNLLRSRRKKKKAKKQ